MAISMTDVVALMFKAGVSSLDRICIVTWYVLSRETERGSIRPTTDSIFSKVTESAHIIEAAPSKTGHKKKVPYHTIGYESLKTWKRW